MSKVPETSPILLANTADFLFFMALTKFLRNKSWSRKNLRHRFRPVSNWFITNAAFKQKTAIKPSFKLFLQSTRTTLMCIYVDSSLSTSVVFDKLSRGYCLCLHELGSSDKDLLSKTEATLIRQPCKRQEAV